MDDIPISRRTLLAGAAGAAAAAAGGVLLTGIPAAAEQRAASSATSTTSALSQNSARGLGAPTTAVGARSPFVNPQRAPIGEITGSARTPLQDLTGTITPSDLHYVDVHAGVPAIDPSKHTLIIHGLVERPIELTVADLKRFPAVARTCFLECSTNGREAYHRPRLTMTPQEIDGLTSNSEWTGVPLSTLFDEVGVHHDAEWFLAEGGDAQLYARSIPVTKARDDAFIAWAQNGEPLRPDQGFPIRLLLPGYEGSSNVKWLRRIKLGTEPFMTPWDVDETDPLPDGKIRSFSFEMDAKSIITSPAYPEKLSAPGWWPITGLAWSGRGRISRVDVSTDGGDTWVSAELMSTLAPKSHVRFQYMWQWTGNSNLLMSRAVDDTGYVQPTLAQLRAARGPAAAHHFNAIRAWRVSHDGTVTFEANT